MIANFIIMKGRSELPLVSASSPLRGNIDILPLIFKFCAPSIICAYNNKMGKKKVTKKDDYDYVIYT